MKANNDVADTAGTSGAEPHIPSRGTKFLNIMEAALAAQHGRLLTYDELGRIADQSTSTIFDWSLGANLRQVEAYIRLLEQLPECKRREVIDSVCRLMPTIYHDRLAWRERQISSCQQLLQLERGLTFVEGDENARDFVVTALGHSMARLDRHRLPVFGIDVRLPDRFVPVGGVKYLGGTLQPGKLKGLVSSAWTAVRECKTGLILLNGLWSHLRERQSEIQELATHCHVVIADELTAGEANAFSPTTQRSNVIVVAEQKDLRITVNFAEFRK